MCVLRVEIKLIVKLLGIYIPPLFENVVAIVRP